MSAGVSYKALDPLAKTRAGRAYPAWRKSRAAIWRAFALGLTVWGAQAQEFGFCHPPHAGPSGRGHALLHMLGALMPMPDHRARADSWPSLPLHPRLAHMSRAGGARLPPSAAPFLAERDPPAELRRWT